MKQIVYRSVSFSDLFRFGIYLEVEEGQLCLIKYKGKKFSKEEFYKALKVFGIKNNQHIGIQSISSHRNLLGEVVEDYRVIGEERNDKKWLDSGDASDEAKISSSKMKDMVGHVARLSNGGER